MKSCWQRSSKQVGIDSDGKGGVSDYDGGEGGPIPTLGSH